MALISGFLRGRQLNAWPMARYSGRGGSEPDDAPNYIHYDDMYADTTWSRVVVGNASTLSASTHREIQPMTAWSDTSITVTANVGSFVDGDQYLFVVDDDGNASPGYRLGLVTTDSCPCSGG